MQLAFNIVTVPKMTPLTMARLEVLGSQVEEMAKSMCPVATGALQNSIRTYIDGNTLVIEADEDYASYVEYGTVKQPPQPFLQPAIYQSRADIMETVLQSQHDEQTTAQTIKNVAQGMNIMKFILNLTK